MDELDSRAIIMKYIFTYKHRRYCLATRLLVVIVLRQRSALRSILPMNVFLLRRDVSTFYKTVNQRWSLERLKKRTRVLKAKVVINILKELLKLLCRAWNSIQLILPDKYIGLQ